VERARIVQEEWADAYDQLAIEIAEAEAAAAAGASGDTSVDISALEKQPQGGNAKQATPNGTPMPGITSTQNIPPYSPSPTTNISPNTVLDGMPSSAPQTPDAGTAALPQSTTNGTTEKKPFRLPPNPHRGQLLPSHVREAHRRYKHDGEGGGVGYSGHSMKGLGIRGAVSCSIGGAGGKRLFR
jgi:transcription initiation factor TFIID subunit 11